jgi:hypothetical protein
MKWGLLPEVARIIAAFGLVFQAQAAHAFSFTEVDGRVRAAEIAHVQTGEVWAYARTESWRQTKNTVWAHCEEVVGSYGDFVLSDVIACQDDVKHANNTTLRRLGNLEVGEEIILPLTRNDAAAYRTQVAASQSVPDEVPIRVETALALLEARSAGNAADIAALRSSVEVGEREISALNAKIGALEAQVKAFTVEEKSLTQEKTSTAGEAPVPGWVGFAVLGIYAILAILLLGSMLKSKTEQLKRQAVEYRNEMLERELEQSVPLDFSRQKYVFDGEEYWIELIYVTKEGRAYRTPFAPEVKEQNLKSHFAQATRKTPHLKAAAE